MSKESTAIMKETMDSMGYKRIKNGWYKIVPSVILCVELQTLSFHSFRINYGIVPFSCYLFHHLELATYELENLNWQKNKDKYIKQFSFLDNTEHFGSADCTTFSLKNPPKYSFYLTFWTDAVNEIALPALQSIHDLKSSCETVEKIWMNKASKYEYFRYAPMFIRNGEYEKASSCIAPYIRHWESEDNSNNNKIEIKATEAWNAWKKKGTHMMSPYLWQWLIQTNDTARLNELITANEKAANDWIKKNRLPSP